MWQTTLARRSSQPVTMDASTKGRTAHSFDPEHGQKGSSYTEGKGYQIFQQGRESNADTGLSTLLMPCSAVQMLFAHHTFEVVQKAREYLIKIDSVLPVFAGD